MPEPPPKAVAVPSNTGNPRITVAFPFSRIEIREQEPGLGDLAALVRQLAEHVAAVSRDVSPERADEADRLAETARRLAASLGAA